MLVHLNGRLVEESAARVSVFDRGFLFGDGIFESMRSVGGRVFRLDRHLERLRRSALLIGLPAPDPDALRTATYDLLRADRLEDARIRLTVTRGLGRPGDYVEALGDPTVVISAAAFAGLAASLHERGVEVAIPHRRALPPESLDPSIKSTSRLVSVLARREARDRGAFEAVWADASGCLTEGTASNLFVVTGGVVTTPPLADGSLPGVTRAAVLELARDAGMEVAEKRLPREILGRAEEVFLTNSSWEVLPVARADGRLVGGGAPGPVSRDLLARYRALVRRECLGG